MRKKIATALVCLALCLSTNTTGTTSAHNHQGFISEVTNANEMMIEEENIIKKFRNIKFDTKYMKKDSVREDSTFNDVIQQQKSNQRQVVGRVTYYYPTGHRTATGHSAKGGEKIIALSPDLLKKIPYHSKVEVEGYGVFTVEDRTASYVRNTVDILLPRGTKINNGKNVTIKVID